MFERFTESARIVVTRTQTHARRLRHRHLGTEHILLALVEDDGEAGAQLRAAGLAVEHIEAAIGRIIGGRGPLGPDDAAALKAIGIDLDEVIARIEENFGPVPLADVPTDQPGECPGAPRRWFTRRRPTAGPGVLRFTPRAKKVLELSLREAIRLREKSIRAEHILLGLLREGEGLAAQILVEAGVDLAALRDRIEASLRRAA